MDPPPGEESSGTSDEDELVNQLALLGQALGNTTRVRIAAVFLRRDEASPREVATLIGDKLRNVAYHFRCFGLVKLQAEEVVDKHGRAIVRAARALANETRIEILGYLLRREPTTATRIAMGMSKPEHVVHRQLEKLAYGDLIRPTSGPNEGWSVPPATRQALVALKEVVEPT